MKIKQMLESIFANKLTESTEDFRSIISEKVANELKKKKCCSDSKPESYVGEEAEELDEARFEKGTDIGKPNVGKDTGFANLAKKAGKEYGSKKSGERVAGAILQKILAKKK